MITSRLFPRGGKHRRYLSWEKIRDFIVKQNDARGDGLGKGYYDQKAKDLVKKYTQHDEHFVHKGFIRCSERFPSSSLLSLAGMNDESFLRYLLSFDNLIVDPAKFDLCMNMDKPLAHYFISSSHNTYLTGSRSFPVFAESDTGQCSLRIPTAWPCKHRDVSASLAHRMPMH